LLNEIKSLLEEFEIPVYYGRSTHKSQDDWNYIVFNKSKVRKSGSSKIDLNYYYQVHIIQEDYIQEGFELEVIKKILNNTNLRLSDSELVYNYTMKNNTNMVVEMLTIEFTMSKKVN
jgi:hypothetical protein